jgi:hypothetical protein
MLENNEPLPESLPVDKLMECLAEATEHLSLEYKKLRNERNNLKVAKRCLEHIISKNVKKLKYTSFDDFHFAPDNLKTPELCLKAVEKDWLSLQDVPENLRTEEICLAALLHNDDALLNAIDWVPKKLITQEFCKKFVTSCGVALSAVPENLRTVELCLEACKAYPYNKTAVPENIKEEVDKLLQQSLHS